MLLFRPYPSSDEEYPEEKPDGSIRVDVLTAETVNRFTVLLEVRKAELCLTGDNKNST